MIAVVVAFKSGSELAICCEGILRSSLVDRVIVVDNSFEIYGSALDAVGLKPSERLIHAIPTHNLGYSGGNNFGIAMAKGLGTDLVLVCNPDVEIDDADIAELKAELADKSLQLISPRLTERDRGGSRVILSSPGWDKWLGRGVVCGAEAGDRRLTPTFFGACFMARMDLLDQIGALSEDFFLYCEEIDYCLRMRAAGLRWGISRKVCVPHGRGLSISPGGSTKKSPVGHHHAARSAIILGRKYWPESVLLWTANRCLLAVLMLIRLNVAGGLAVLKGVIQGWRKRLMDKDNPNGSPSRS